MQPEESNQSNQPQVASNPIVNQDPNPVPQPTVITPTEGVVPNNVQPVPGVEVPVSVTPGEATPTVQPISSTDIAKQSKKGGLIAKIGTIPLIVIAILLLAGGGAGAYFGVVLPNNPANLWKTALNNTGKGLDKYVEYSKSMENEKGGKFKGNFNADASGTVFDGTFDGSFYEKNLNLKADIGAAGSRVNLEVLTNTPESAKNPDIYMRVKGLDGLSSVLGSADPSTSQLLAKVNNQWYVVDHTLLDQVGSQTGNSSVGVSSLSSKDIADIEAAIVSPTKDHLLSTAPDKAVLVVKQNVGNEELDSRKVYHYRVGVNKENTKHYFTALKDGLRKTKLGSSYKDDYSFEKSIDFDGLMKDVDKWKDDGTADVWVDKSTRLIRSIKITDKDHITDYMQVSLNYNGGSSYPVVLKFHSESDQKTDMTLNLEQNVEKKTGSLELSLDAESDGTKVKASAKLTTEVSNDKVEFTKPTDAKSIYELIGGLMGGTPVLGDSTNVPSILGNFDL